MPSEERMQELATSKSLSVKEREEGLGKHGVFLLTENSACRGGKKSVGGREGTRLRGRRRELTWECRWRMCLRLDLEESTFSLKGGKKKKKRHGKKFRNVLNC